MKLKPPSRIKASDYRRVIALWQAAGLHIRPNGRDSEEAFTRQFDSGLQTGIAIENEAGALVGIALATHDGRRGWINRLAVHPEYRRQGVAAMLIAEAEAVLHDQGMDVISALIEQDNLASLTLFEKSGYIEHVGLHYVSKRSSDEA